MQGTIAGKLPHSLLKLFSPRPPPPFFKPVGKDPNEPGPNKLSGVAETLARIKQENEEKLLSGEATEEEEREGKRKFTLAAEWQKQLKKEEKKKQQAEYKKSLESNWKPQEDAEAVGDPYKTLFISRLSKKTTESDLRKEFEMYGAIERVRIVKDLKGRSKSYGFVVFERERDMKAAYKDAEGIPIHHKKILVDVERGRTVKGWKPRKLGGGLGGRPKPVDPAAVAVTPAFGGGFRGRGGMAFGGRGGFVPRGSFVPRGGFRGGFQGGDRGGFGGGGDRGGFGGGDRGRGGFQSGGGFRGGFQGGGGSSGGYVASGAPGFQGGAGAPGGGAPGFGGGGVGFQNRGFGGAPPQAGPPAGGFKRDYGNDQGPGGGGGGGYGGGAYGGGGGGGYDDRDSKRPRY